MWSLRRHAPAEDQRALEGREPRRLPQEVGSPGTRVVVGQAIGERGDEEARAAARGRPGDLARDVGTFRVDIGERPNVRDVLVPEGSGHLDAVIALEDVARPREQGGDERRAGDGALVGGESGEQIPPVLPQAATRVEKCSGSLAGHVERHRVQSEGRVHIVHGLGIGRPAFALQEEARHALGVIRDIGLLDHLLQPRDEQRRQRRSRDQLYDCLLRITPEEAGKLGGAAVDVHDERLQCARLTGTRKGQRQPEAGRRIVSNDL